MRADPRGARIVFSSQWEISLGDRRHNESRDVRRSASRFLATPSMRGDESRLGVVEAVDVGFQGIQVWLELLRVAHPPVYRPPI